MLLTEYNEAEAMELFIKDGEKKGIKKGENRLADLMSKLFELGRSDDAERAVKDQAYRDSLYEEFNIV